MTRNKTFRRSRPDEPTVHRPWVDLSDFIGGRARRIEAADDYPAAFRFIDPDSGCVVYETPYMGRDSKLVRESAFGWARRNFFVSNDYKTWAFQGENK